MNSVTVKMKDGIVREFNYEGCRFVRERGQLATHARGGAMSSITVTMKDGTVREFKHAGRAGGSYTKSLKFEGAFAIIEDEYYRRTAIPAADIAEIVERPEHG